MVKNFYAECPQVQQRTDEEVVQWRQEKQVRVQGTMQIKPILSFNEIQLPPILLDIIHRKLSLTRHAVIISTTSGFWVDRK